MDTGLAGICIMQKTVWEQCGPGRNVKARGNEVEGLGSQVPFQPPPERESGIQPPFFGEVARWSPGNQGGGGAVDEQRPPQGTAHTWGSTNAQALASPFMSAMG